MAGKQPQGGGGGGYISFERKLEMSIRPSPALVVVEITLSFICFTGFSDTVEAPLGLGFKRTVQETSSQCRPINQIKM